MTYIRTNEGFMYAALITDAFSRKIVGAHIGDTLEAEGCIKALSQALTDLPEGRRPIHHSDRGCQYCCHAYVEKLQEHGMRISMTEITHCYENAVEECVSHRRLHSSLSYRFPAEIHARQPLSSAAKPEARSESNIQL